MSAAWDHVLNVVPPRQTGDTANQRAANLCQGEQELTKQELKNEVCAAIDAKAAEIIAFADDIFAHPELGYKEFRTAGKVAEKFDALGLTYQKGIGITGLKSRVKGRPGGPTVCVLGELDSVLCPGHPNADPQTGAAHSCGHNAQLAAVLGVAYGFLGAKAMEQLAGDLVLVAVPAEEYVEIEYRSKLRREGKIRFLGGKQQFILEGAFDDVDMAMMMHSMVPAAGSKVKMGVGGTSNGFVGKFVKYKGKEAHSGGAPHAGVNALNAAMLGLMGIHAQRETLQDDDTIRIHPIITKGGDLVNIVPADVRIETYVRGKRMPAIIDAARKVDRALRAGAMAVGAEVEIETLPGYLPRNPRPSLTASTNPTPKPCLGRAPSNGPATAPGRATWATCQASCRLRRYASAASPARATRRHGASLTRNWRTSCPPR